MKSTRNKYNNLLKNIGLSIDKARLHTLKTVNATLVQINWEIGRHIVEFEQQGQERAEYGTELLTKLSKDL